MNSPPAKCHPEYYFLISSPRNTMAVYYDFLLDIGVSSPCNFLLAGHERYSLLAVGCEGRSHAGQVLGAVNIFTEEVTVLCKVCATCVDVLQCISHTFNVEVVKNRREKKKINYL